MILPKKVAVRSVVSSRYSGARPADWDKRVAGIDVVCTAEGETITLVSSGQQSSPKVGWTLMLTGERPGTGYEWTLYGIPKAAGDEITARQADGKAGSR